MANPGTCYKKIFYCHFHNVSKEYFWPQKIKFHAWVQKCHFGNFSVLPKWHFWTCFYFWRKLKTPKRHFEVNWSLWWALEKGLFNLLKSGWVIAHPAHSSLTSLRYIRRHKFKKRMWFTLVHERKSENQRKICNLFCLVCLNQILKGVFQLGIVNICSGSI